MQLKRYTCNSFFSYTNVDTSAIEGEWKMRGWDDPVGKRLSRTMTAKTTELQGKERELLQYLEELDRGGALDNETVRYRRMTDAIKANTVEGI